MSHFVELEAEEDTTKLIFDVLSAAIALGHRSQHLLNQLNHDGHHELESQGSKRLPTPLEAVDFDSVRSVMSTLIKFMPGVRK